MKRTLFLIAAASLALGGCSGKAADPAAGDPDGAVLAAVAKPNPWNSGSAAEAPAAAPANEQAEAAKPAAAEPTNPWAKGPPAGAAPPADPAAKEPAPQ